VFEKFQETSMMVERQTSKRIKVLRSNNGKEFVNNALNKYLRKNGIKRQQTVPYTLQQNCVSERCNRTLIEMARTMLLGSNLCESLWAEAVNTAVYLRNRASTRALKEGTPYENFFGRKPYVGHLKVFGSLAIGLDKQKKGKFMPRGKEYTLVGYSDTSKAYRLYSRERREFVISRDV